MLITTCSHCQSRFRVTPQQLNTKQGQVRCGRCRRVFNGFEALERFPDDDTGARLLAEREGAQAEPPPPDIAAVEALPDDEGLSDIEQALQPDPAPKPEPAEPATRRRRYAPSAEPAPAPALSLEPPPRRPPSRAWSFGVALLVLVIGVELAFAIRGPLAQRYPASRPVLEAACGYIRCTVPYSRVEALLKLEESDLLEVPGRPGEIALGARIRNLASVAQEYPHLELSLSDLTGQAAARRVMRPTDYLGRPVHPGEVLGPGMELAVQLRLELPRLRATGYELLLFYP